MKNKSEKVCNRKKCPYYYDVVCTHRFECTHSKLHFWIKSKEGERK